jgi:Putative heavy-metal-binding
VNASMITSTFELPGHAIAKNLGIVRGITVRSRSIVGNFVGGIQSLFGGNWIPAFWVPALLVTHYITFVVLLKYWKGVP